MIQSSNKKTGVTKCVIYTSCETPSGALPVRKMIFQTQSFLSEKANLVVLFLILTLTLSEVLTLTLSEMLMSLRALRMGRPWSVVCAVSLLVPTLCPGCCCTQYCRPYGTNSLLSHALIISSESTHSSVLTT